MADWMSELPTAARDKPLMTLAIPGSHHSASYNLKEDSEITPDQPWCVRVLTPNDMIRKAVHNWSKDQSLSIKQQLEAGVRYLDVTLAFINDDFYVIHGLRCMEVRDLFKDVNDFTNAHRKEIVLIDLNRFYDFKEAQHEKLFALLDSIFGNKLIDRPGTPRIALSLTLNKLWTAPGQVIVFYQPTLPSSSPSSINGHAGPSDVVKLPNYVWSRQFIRNPWPRTDDPQEMVREVSDIISNRNLDDGFQACQAIVTLTVNSVIRQPTGTFEARYARRATRTLVDWLRENGYRHRSNANIIVADFVDEEDFCSAIIDLNR
uniref:Phosphatidylinositol-specific phospholipase C X domain-containing protein n=1 Tax=Parascaris univalens TaxID=6257 RepID=A0A915ARK9_PARUN